MARVNENAFTGGMEISFSTMRLAEICNNRAETVRSWGAANGSLVCRRLSQLAAVPNLELMTTIPGARCHQLGGDRSGQFAVDLNPPLQLIFAPENKPLPLSESGRIDQVRVTKIRIIEVAGYHGD
jgi:plasmid maintenance system killer protein